MDAYAFLAYGVILTNEDAYEFEEKHKDKLAEYIEKEKDAGYYQDTFHFEEWFEQFDDLELSRSGADDCNYCISPKGYVHKAEWGEWHVVHMPEVSSIAMDRLNKFCELYDIEKNYAWRLGALYW